MHVPYNTSALRAPSSHAALPAADSPTFPTNAGVSQMQWTLAAVCGLIIGVFALSLAIPPCLHAVKQLRQGRQRLMPNGNHPQLGQAVSQGAIPAQTRRVEWGEARPLPLPGKYIFNMFRRTDLFHNAG